MEQGANTETQETDKTEQQEAVKKEPEETDFLDDILRNADDIAAAVASTSNSVKPEPEPNANEDLEEIDPNFFDEILVRAEEERREVAPKRIRSVKRERIELEDGEVDDDTDDNQNKESSKSKKSKKAKRKKSRDSPKKIKKERNDEPQTSSTAAAPESNKPRIQIRAEFRSFRAATPTSPPPEEPTAAPEDPQMEIETHIGNSTCYQPIPFQLSIRQDELIEQKPEKELTSEEKLCKALERIMYAKRAFQKAKEQSEKKFYPNDPVFAYTPTVRKLPTSFSYFTQQIYDNRSPLHTVNNVTFQFNSMATRLSLQDWGLESLPPKSRVIARTLGYDVDTLYAKKQSIKIPDKIQKSSENKTKAEERELCEPNNSTLFMNVMVQTDEVKIIPSRRRDFYRDVGLQFTPSTNVTGTQTNPAYTGEGAELPLFKIIRELNENQLEALDDFVQFILEPVGNSGLDVYQQRKRLADIYKTSQIPADVQHSLKRSASHARLPDRMPSPPPPPNIYIQSDFIKREPDTHHHSSERRRSQPHYIRGVHSQPISHYIEIPDDKPSPSVKYYGRGGMRR